MERERKKVKGKEKGESVTENRRNFFERLNFDKKVKMKI